MKRFVIYETIGYVVAAESVEDASAVFDEIYGDEMEEAFEVYRERIVAVHEDED